MFNRLTADNLVKNYGATVALNNVSLQLAQGELLGLLGPNGAGKTTLVKSCCGLVWPSKGTVTVCGHRAGSKEARSQIGYLAELFRFPEWCSANELLLFHQKLSLSSSTPTLMV